MDTNVVIYLYSQTETDKWQAVQRIAGDFDCFISTQVINEFCSVYISKLKVPVDKVRLYVTEMAREFPTVQMKNPALKGGVSSLDRKFIILAGVHTLVTLTLNSCAEWII